MRPTLFLALLLASLLASAPSYSQEDGQPAVDYLALAGRLVRDGDYLRAERTLKKVSEDERNSQNFILVSSLLQLYQEHYQVALQGFDTLINMGTKDRYVYIYKGQAHYGLKEYQQTLDAFNRVQDLADSIVSINMIRSRCFWALGQWQRAWQQLHQAIATNPGDFRLLRLKTAWLLEKKLHQQAYEFILAELDNPTVSLNDKVSLALALRAEGLLDSAIKILEILHLQHQDKPEVTVQLAYSYAKLGLNLNAAQLFYQASLWDSERAFEAAELYRKVGRTHQALTLNRQVSDQKRKFQQRLAILISRGHFEEAAATEADLARLGLLESEEIRYALAFALFKSNQFAQAERHLNQIFQGKLRTKVVALREEMLRCQSESLCG